MKEHLLSKLRDLKDSEEFYREASRYLPDPCRFIAETCKIHSYGSGISKFIPVDYQRKLIEQYQRQHTIVNHARASGVSTTTSLYLFWYAMFNANAQIGIVANKMDMCKMNLDIIQTAYELLPAQFKEFNPMIKDMKPSIRFENGANIVTVSSPDCLRGRTFDLVHLDNFGYIPNRKQEEFLSILLPHMLPNKKSRVLISSAGGAEDSSFRRIYSLATIDESDFVPVEIKPDK